jgi:hypothetical protein
MPRDVFTLKRVREGGALLASSVEQPSVGGRGYLLEFAQAGGARRPCAHQSSAVERGPIAVVARLGLKALQFRR